MSIPTPHINAKKEDIAKTVLMPGDPLRAKLIADSFLENAVLVNNVRGVQGHTGTWRGVPVTVMASGTLSVPVQDSSDSANGWELMERLLVIFLGLAVGVIVALGIYLSRLLSRQIIEPLSELRRAAAVSADDADAWLCITQAGHAALTDGGRASRPPPGSAERPGRGGLRAPESMAD